MASNAGQLEVVQFLAKECDGVNLDARDKVISCNNCFGKSKVVNCVNFRMAEQHCMLQARLGNWRWCSSW